MTWKRSLAIALCSGVLWMFADRTARADDKPKDGKAPPPRQRPDGPPPGAPDDRPDADPSDDGFGPPRPADEAGRPGRRGFGPGGPGQPMRRDGEPKPEGQGGPAMQGPPGQPGGMPGGMGGGYGGYGPGFGRGFGGYGGYGGMMMRQDPEIFKEAEIDRKVQSLVETYRNEDEKNAKREEIQKEIEKLVGEQFDLRQKRRENELKRMEEQIKRLRETIEKRQNAREEIINRHIKELLGQEDEMQF